MSRPTGAGVPISRDTDLGRSRAAGPGVALARSAAALSTAGAIAAVWMHHRNVDAGAVSVLSASDVVVAVVYPVVGAMLVRRRPTNVVGWILVATSLIGVYAFSGQYAVAGLVVDPGSLPLASVAAWVSVWGWAPLLLLPTLLPLLFPDGRLPSARWRPVALGIGMLVAVAALGRMVAETESDVSPLVENPAALTFAANYVVAVASFAVALLGAPLCVTALVLRTRAARGRLRAQLEWLLVGGVAAAVATIAQLPVPEPWGDWVFAAGLVAIPATIVIAVARHQLLDIDVILNRALVYLALSAGVLAAYLLAVAAVGELAFGQRLAYAVVALAALAAASVRDRVQGAVERLLFGERRDPYAVVTRLGDQLDVARGPVEALGSLVSGLQVALKLPYVAVRPVANDVEPVAVGAPVAAVEQLPLALGGTHIGVLEVGHRHDGERFRDDERSLLVDVARRAAAFVYAADLVADLQRNRERLVVAREEERRRLRHDLHDSLGPQLAGMALQLERLGDDLPAGSAVAAQLDVLGCRLREAVADVRRIVDDLRPASLDELGLVGALRERVSIFADADADALHRGPHVRLDVDPELGALPAAVEVAAYRIALEGLTNVIRHARASTCRLELTIDRSSLVVRVEDDGVGVDDGIQPGVGLVSMRNRAAELGGTLDVSSRPEGGTIVEARLPLEAQ